jgi:CHAT domain-containing protein/tetratricopeptide (TPR) repeat protein
MKEQLFNSTYISIGIILSLVTFHNCSTPSMLVTQEQQKGDYYNNQYQYEQAIFHYKNCLSASAKLGTLRNRDMESVVCRKSAHAFSALGQFDNAIQYVFMALGNDSIRNNQLEIIEDNRLLGKLNLYKGDFKKGISYLEHALELNKGMESSLKGLNQLSVAETYLSLAQVSSVLGKFDQAGNFARLALDIYKKLGDKNGIMEGELLLGNIYLDLGMVTESLELFENSMLLARELELSTARHHQSLGKAYSVLADFEKALRHKMDALEAAEQSRIIPQIVWSSIGVGDAYADMGNAEDAKKYFEYARKVQDTSKMEALALQASGNIRLGELIQAGRYYNSIDAGVASGLILLRMGEMNYNAGKADTAIQNYNNAIEYFTRFQSREGIAKANLRLGDIYIEKHEYVLAAAYLKKAFGLTTNDETIWEIWYQKGRIFEQTQQPDSAITAYKKAVEIIEEIRGRFTIEEYKSKYINNKVKVYDRLILLLLESGTPDEAFFYSERARARAFLDMIGNKKINVKHTDDQELITREQDLRLQINSLSKMIQSNDLGSSRGLSRYEVEEELARSREEYASLLEQIKLKNLEYASMVSIEPTPLTKLQEHLDDHTALMAYWISDEYMVIWILTSNKLIPYVTKTPSAEIIKSVSDARRAVREVSDFPDDNQERYQPLSDNQQSAITEGQTSRDKLYHIYNQLIKPVEGFLTGYTNLGIIPHGALHFLPFQALIMSDGHFLVEKFNLFYTPSASVYIFCKEKEHHPTNQMLAMALGDYGLGDFSSLPGTRQEVEQIRNIFNDITVRYEDESTETFAKTNVSLFRYIHFATHGLLDANQPLYSYLLFAPTEIDDGFLTVNEVFGLNLNASLVTLSACQTGLGDLSHGDEIIGLSRAFLYAGATSVIVSLWSVADQPTALLMTMFYRNLDHHSPQEALSMAQREVMKQYPAPFYWAPFQLIGRGE